MEYAEMLKELKHVFTRADLVRTLRMSSDRFNHILNGGRCSKAAKKRIEILYLKKIDEIELAKSPPKESVKNYDDELSDADDLTVPTKREGYKNSSIFLAGEYDF